MTLFHIDHTIKNDNLIITDTDTISQCKKVLRLNIGDLIHVQSTLANTTTRHLIKITDLSKTLTGNIIETISKDISTHHNKGMFIAMSNKRDKIELISQKLTEIGLGKIIFRPSDRSVIKERNHTKAARIQKIIKEATEQSRSRHMPELSYREHPEDLLENTNLIIFDKQENNSNTDKINEAFALLPSEEYKENQNPPSLINREGVRGWVIGLIGPEGGLSPKDYTRFSQYPSQIYALGDSVLRTETAAIIGGWIIKNGKQ